MGTILDRMRLERRITVVILVVLLVVAFVYELFFGWNVYMSDRRGVESAQVQGAEQ